MSLFHDSAIVGASGQAGAAGYQIERSLRFNSSDSAYLSKNFGSAGNRKTWTWAGWVKRSKSGTHVLFFGGPTDSTLTRILFNTEDLEVHSITSSTYNLDLKTSAVYRDFSAWFHCVVSVDTTQATSSNRAKIYINGLQVTQFATATYPSQNYDTYINTTNKHSIGVEDSSLIYYKFDGYLADIHFIDGQALDPTSFTEVSATTGQLIPKAYTGTFTGNSFWLKFADNSAATATTLGKDSSGLGNNWTPNNLSVTAGAGNDSLVDTPTSYGTDTGVGAEVRGNYCTWNALNGSGALANGNLDFTSSATTHKRIGTIGITSGKWYFECVCTAQATTRQGVGIGNATFITDTNGVGATANSWGVLCESGAGNGFLYYNNSSPADIGTINVNDVINVAYDADSDKLWFGVNGTWYNSGNPAAGTNASFTGVSGDTLFPVISGGGETPGTIVTNFGQRSWAYAAPAGFKALCDTNLPAPVVAKPSTVMDVKLYTGNGSTQTISGLGFSPDLVWMKSRSAVYSNHLVDVVRGGTKALVSDSTASEYTSSNYVTSFDSSGFSIGNEVGINNNGTTYVGWTWDAGTTTTTNTQGSITSQVRTNASAGFSIVTYTGAASGTVGHGLGVAPSLIIAKSRTVVKSWVVYHKDLGINQYLLLNSTNAAGSATGVWGTSAPSSTVFGLETSSGGGNNDGDLVAYCFAPVSGYSAMGSYTGNGSSDGPFVYTGFRPRWLMIKRSSSSGYNWQIHDTERIAYNVNTKALFANAPDSEYTFSSAVFDMLSNGFKARGSDSYINANGETYIYAAFAESPFAYARAR